MKLREIIDNARHDSLVSTYNLFWSDGQRYNIDDIKQHLKKYLVQFYLFRNINPHSREKCIFLIYQLRSL